MSLYDLLHFVSAVASVTTVAAVFWIIGATCQRPAFGRLLGERPTCAGKGTPAAAHREAVAAAGSPDSNTGDKVTQGSFDGV